MTTTKKKLFHTFTLIVGLALSTVNSLSVSRRKAVLAIPSAFLAPVIAHAEAELPDRFDVENYIKTGSVAMPMGVSGQAGKSRPETGVVLREGSEVQQDTKGNVLAEILLTGNTPVLASFTSPWPLATGSVFDVECRDLKTGDGAFLAVSGNTNGKNIGELSRGFFVDSLFGRMGRFSFYGEPTDIKVKSSTVNGNYRVLDLAFSVLSQSTQTEIPRLARVIATIPSGTNQVVMLVGSSSTVRWNKGTDKQIASVVESFRAIPAPASSLKIRAKEVRRG